jgi:hypothetical protein
MGDVVTAIDVAPPGLVTVSIVELAALLDGGSVVARDGGASALPVFAIDDRLAPRVRVDVQSRGGDPTADVVVGVTASLMPAGSSTTATSAKLNETQYEVVTATNTKVYGYSDTPLDLHKLSTGTYTLVVTATTAGGTTASATATVYVDGGPSITFLTPADGVFVKGSVVVTAIVIDNHANLGAVDFSVGQVLLPDDLVSTNGSQYTATLDFGSFNPPLDGPQVVTVTATNANGVVSVATRKFTIDSQGPTISGTQPGTGALIGKLITIKATVSDEGGVMENSVVAVVAHGDVHFEVHLDKAPDGSYKQLFDTTQLPSWALFPSISFRAQDNLGNQSSVGYLLSLDNTPPILSLDPPDQVRVVKSDNTCSQPFDPVGPDAIDDGSVVNQLFDIRARIEDQGNTPQTGIPDFVPISTVDPASVKVLILDDTSIPLVVDTSDPPDKLCDDINPDLVPSVSPQSSRDAQLIDMVSLSPGGAADFSKEYGMYCSGDSAPPSPPCETTHSLEKDQTMTYTLGYAAANLPAIWTVPPVVGDGLQCAGRQFDASNNLHDGWACVAVEAADKLGNKQVSRPIRICVAAQLNSAACTALASGGADLASVTLPSSRTGRVVVTTKTTLLSAGGAPVATGDELVFSAVAPPELAKIHGRHTVEVLASGGTQFALSDLSLSPFGLWVDNLDGKAPVEKGPVGLVLAAGAEVQVVTDQPETALDAGFAGKVILLAKGSDAANGERWTAANIQPTGFTLKGSAPKVAGFATPSVKLPNCTGTVVKGTGGAPATTDATKHCEPWASFPDLEWISK